MVSTSISVAIIGGGFSGMAVGIELLRRGIEDFVILEASDGVGGTWRHNTYPGCACDIPSHLYSFSFEQNPQWSRAFGGQAEILAYLEKCADKYGLRPHLRLGTTVQRADYDEATARWRLTLENGAVIDANVVVAGTGALSHPAMPKIPGLEKFEGPAFHSAKWDHDVDLTGRDVAVIGTGASAIQIVPAIADQVRQLTVFQRTPPWIMPRPDFKVPAKLKAAYDRHPWLMRLHRGALYWALEGLGSGLFALPSLMKLRERRARAYLDRAVPDPELRAKLRPAYAMGCKRILISSDYYRAFERSNVELVTDSIESIDATAVVTRDGQRHEVDAIVLCTGFAIRDFLAPLEVIGRDGQRLRDAWRDGVEAYYGMAVSGFPNFFMMTGPNTGLGHNSMVFMIESQARYVGQCIDHLRRKGLAAMEVRPQAQRKHNAGLQSRMADVVWTSGCRSWYLDDNGRNFALWPGFTFEYWLRTRRVNKRAYECRPAG